MAAFSKNKLKPTLSSATTDQNPRINSILPLISSYPSPFETMVVDGWTGVFWDMDDFPLPPELDLDLFVKNVKSTIWNNGFRGDVEFFAFGSSDSFDYDRYLDSKSFTAFKVVDNRTRFYTLLHTVRSWVQRRQQYGGTKNVLVITKGIPGEDNNNMVSFLDKILDRGHNVFTVVPDGCSPENFDYPEPIVAWYWSAFCSGGSSIDLYSSTDDDSGSGSPDRSQGVKRASETDTADSAKKLCLK